MEQKKQVLAIIRVKIMVGFREFFIRSLHNNH